VGGIAMLFGALLCAARVFCVGPMSLALCMLLFGLHIGFVAPSVPKALAVAVPAQKLARANGLALLGYTITTALMMLGARTLLSPLLGWRGSMLFAAGLMVVVAVAWLRVVRDGVSGRHGSLAEMITLTKHPGLVRVAVMHFVVFGGYLALLGILPHVLGKTGGLAIAAWLIFAAIANFMGPWISDRIGSRRIVLALGTFVCGAALLALAVSPARSALIFLPLAALGGGAAAPLLLTLPLEMDKVGPARAGSALGMLMLVGQIGGFLLPAASGAMGGRYGFGAAIALLAVAHVLAALPALGLGRRREMQAFAAGST
jgi:predicted MFS family arabinose efflux permease